MSQLTHSKRYEALIIGERRSYEDMSQAPYDRRKAIENFGGAEVLKEASSVYLEEAQSQYEHLKQALLSQDFERVREVAHLIKGGLVYLHAHPSANAARKIEELASTTPGEHLAEMKQSLDTLQIELNSLLVALQDEL